MVADEKDPQIVELFKQRLRLLLLSEQVISAQNPPKIWVRMKEITPKAVLAIRCPTCGAPPGVRCELSTGQPRTEPHRDRRLIAAEKSG